DAEDESVLFLKKNNDAEAEAEVKADADALAASMAMHAATGPACKCSTVSAGRLCTPYGGPQ
ncbi:MAG TPA: hypothetical protein P5290_01330, partial [Candidatus Methanomethylicus sp.]|nr:hypothetical protein [Candidatus Methanomethylicus sp.]